MFTSGSTRRAEYAFSRINAFRHRSPQPGSGTRYPRRRNGFSSTGFLGAILPAGAAASRGVQARSSAYRCRTSFPGMYHHTIEALKHVRPTEFMSTPVGFQMLAQALETEDGLAAAFFSRIRSMSSGGAALAADTFERIQTAAGRARGCKIPFTTVYGATEVQSVAMVHWLSDATGAIGGPLPGVQLRLRPVAGKYARCEGANRFTGHRLKAILSVPMPDGYFRDRRCSPPRRSSILNSVWSSMAVLLRISSSARHMVDAAPSEKGSSTPPAAAQRRVVCGVNEDLSVLGFPGASAFRGSRSGCEN